jgi:hypothetical protein
MLVHLEKEIILAQGREIYMQGKLTRPKPY